MGYSVVLNSLTCETRDPWWCKRVEPGVKQRSDKRDRPCTIATAFLVLRSPIRRPQSTSILLMDDDDESVELPSPDRTYIQNRHCTYEPTPSRRGLRLNPLNLFRSKNWFKRSDGLRYSIATAVASRTGHKHLYIPLNRDPSRCSTNHKRASRRQ